MTNKKKTNFEEKKRDLEMHISLEIVHALALLIQDPRFQSPRNKNLIPKTALMELVQFNPCAFGDEWASTRNRALVEYRYGGSSPYAFLDECSSMELARIGEDIRTLFYENNENSSDLRIDAKYRSTIQPFLEYIEKLRDSNNPSIRRDIKRK